jgi:hypothetical protein
MAMPTCVNPGLSDSKVKCCQSCLYNTSWDYYNSVLYHTFYLSCNIIYHSIGQTFKNISSFLSSPSPQIPSRMRSLIQPILQKTLMIKIIPLETAFPLYSKLSVRSHQDDGNDDGDDGGGVCVCVCVHT